MDPYLGEIKLCAFPFAPRGWAFCNGALLPVKGLSYFPCKIWRFGLNSSYRSMPCAVANFPLAVLRMKNLAHFGLSGQRRRDA